MDRNTGRLKESRQGSICASRMYSKSELAQLYFPMGIGKEGARRHLMTWIKRCLPLWQKLGELGYDKRSQFFSPRMVKCIFEYLGEPGD